MSPALVLAAALALNPAVTQHTIATTICVPGYSAHVRPPASYTRKVKARLLHGRSPRGFVLDHWIPISIGGAGRDPRNLVLQPAAEAKRKDRLERQLHAAVCAHRVSLNDAQARMKAWRP